MLKIENHCCNCAVPGYPCRGSLCSLRKVKVYYCDKCETEIDGDIYDVDDQELCEDCVLDMFRRKGD